MGLLDGFPDGWLGLLREPAPNWNGISADPVNYTQPLMPQPRRLPLSFAGPSLATDYPNRDLAQPPAQAPFGAFPGGLGAAPSNDAAGRQTISQSPAPIAQNLTAHVLRAKGVSEPDIAAAVGNPELMKQLINQTFGPGSTTSASRIGHATDSNKVSGHPFAYSAQAADAQPNGFDSRRAGQATPYAGSQRENSRPPFEDAPINLAQVFALPPVTFFARPPVYIPRQLTPLEKLPSGSAGGPNAGKPFPRWMNRQQPDDVPCTYCGRPTKRTPGPDPERHHGDHVIPRSQGGNSDPPNHTPACQACNLGKGDRTPEQWYKSMQKENRDDGIIGEDLL